MVNSSEEVVQDAAFAGIGTTAAAVAVQPVETATQASQPTRMTSSRAVGALAAAGAVFGGYFSDVLDKLTGKDERETELAPQPTADQSATTTGMSSGGQLGGSTEGGLGSGGGGGGLNDGLDTGSLGNPHQ